MTTLESGIEEMTRCLRTAQDPFWQWLRATLTNRDIPPAFAWLAVLFEDDQDYEFGIVVTPDRRVVELGVLWSKEMQEPQLVDWADRTDQWDGLPQADAVRAALTIATAKTDTA